VRNVGRMTDASKLARACSSTAICRASLERKCANSPLLDNCA
jgi:hypothetical protein